MVLYLQIFDCGYCGKRTQAILNIKSDKEKKYMEIQEQRCPACKKKIKGRLEAFKGKVYSFTGPDRDPSILLFESEIMRLNPSSIEIFIDSLLSMGFNGNIKFSGRFGECIVLRLNSIEDKWYIYPKEGKKNGKKEE
jgi:hypothetical protein